jgi:class 3 adenylate cyclase
MGRIRRFRWITSGLWTRVGRGSSHAARIAALASGGEILASLGTIGPEHPTSGARSVVLKGLTEPMEIVAVDWR